MATKFKLPDFNTVQTEYKPRFKASLQSGLFKRPDVTTQPTQPLFGQPQQTEVVQTETEKKISDLQRQVDNLTTRLEAADATEEPARNWFEKMVNLPAGQVWWQDAFDLIDRPVRAIKEGLTDKSFASAWEAFSGNRPGPFQEGYMEGSQFLVNMGVINQETLEQASPGLKLFLDLSVDIFADPLTYTGPIKILKSLGILSDSKIVTKFDDVIKQARKAGLTEVSEKVARKAVDDGLVALRKTLGQSGKSADEIADLIRRPISELAQSTDDVVRRAVDAYQDVLKKAGVLDDAGFRKMLNGVEQALDSNGRVIFQGGAKAVFEISQEVSNLKTLLNITGEGKSARVIINRATKKIASLQRRIAKLAPDSAQAVRLGMQVDELQEVVTNINRIAESSGINLLDKKVLLPGEMTEKQAAELARDLMQNNVNSTLGENVLVVAEKSSAQGTDLALYYRTQDGFYTQLKNADGSRFMFEIKDPKRFSLVNSNLTAVNADTVSELKKAADAVADKSSREYLEAHQKYLVELEIYKRAGSSPTFKLTEAGDIIKKYGQKTYDELNKTIQRIFKGINEGNYTMAQFFDYLGRYQDEVARLVKNYKGTLDDAAKAKLKRQARQTVYKDAPVGLSATITAKGKIADDVVTEMLKLTEMTNPKNAYGFVVRNANNVDELIILNQEDFFKSVSVQEFSMQSTIRTRNQAKQSLIHTYLQVDFDKIDDIAKSNGWFMEALEGTAEQTGRFLRQERVVKEGLIVRMLNGVKKTNIPFVSQTAELIAKAVDGFTFLFNAKAGLKDELAEFLSKIPAEDIQAAKLSVAKVDNIVKDIITQSKGRFDPDFIKKTINELIEQGWDGVTLAGRRMNFEDVWLRWTRQYSKAGTAQFSALDGPQFTNFQNTITDILRREGLDPNLIKLTRREKFTLVEFADGVTVKELEEIGQALSPTIAQQVIDLGKAPLTSRQLAFAKDFNAPIQQIIEESLAQREMLRRLGFEFKDGVLGTGSYFRHAINPRMLAFLKKNNKASIKKFLDAGTDLLKERIYVGSTSEINAAVREMFGISIDLFSTDVTYNFADLVRVASTKNEMSTVLNAILKEQDTLGRNLFEVVDELELSARNMKNNYTVLGGSFKAEFPNLFKNISPETQELLIKYFADKGLGDGGRAIAIQKSAYGVIKRLDNAYVQLPEFIKSFDQYMKFWKTFALITPGYHMRNFFGNITNSFMVGMPLASQSRYMFKSSFDFIRYKRVLRALENGEDVSRFGQGYIDAYKRVDDYYRSGASQSHRGVRDMEIIKEGLREARGQKRNLAQKVGDTLLNLNYTMAENMDDYQRYSLYLWSYDTAGNSKAVRSAKKAGASFNEIDILKRREAYKKVSEALFDYSHLTAFEKEYMKRLFPFYTFFKNNLILQAKTIFNRPGQYAKLFRSYRYYTESMTGMDIEDLPNYMTDNLWIPMPYTVKKGDKEAIEWLRLNLPPSDFTEFVENPFARGVTSLTTPIKFAIELGTGRDLFTGRQIREFPGQQSVYQSEGFLKNLRDERGRLSFSTDPYIIKFLNDVGFRSLFNYGTAAVDLIDFAAGTITRDDMAQKIVDSLGLTRVQELDDLEVASLYQSLDRLRDIKDLYQQENDGQLPTLKQIAELAKEEQQQQGGVFSNLFG